jgi:hypothetical protein
MTVRDEMESVIRRRLTSVVAAARAQDGPALTAVLNDAVTAVLSYADAYAASEVAAAAARSAVAGGDTLPGRRRRMHLPRPGDVYRMACGNAPAGPEWVTVLPDQVTCPRCRRTVLWADAVRRLAASR